MTNKQVAELFANTDKQVRTAHLFIDDATIFSYGYHFPIARKSFSKQAFITTRKYSRTTSRHVSLVKFALSQAGYTLIECEDPTNPTVTMR